MPRVYPVLILIAAGCAAACCDVSAQQDRPLLPEGPGRAAVETACSRCHGLDQIPGFWGATQTGWARLITSMVELPPDQAGVIAGYLAANFPEKPAPPAVVIDGPVTVTIREWVVPTLGSRPHDPLSASDGSIWWTGQFSSRLGRLDPATGTMTEFPLPTPDSGPHGLTKDQQGRIWFTAISKNTIGRLDPATGDVSEYALPAGSRGLHTPVFDQKGRLWFSMQSGAVGPPFRRTARCR